MKEHKYQQDTDGIEVEVTPYFVPEKSNLKINYYFYAYQINIVNRSSETVQLLERQWTIRNGKGEEDVIRGEGVVGKQPILKPDDSFSYTSFCPLHTETGNMRGIFYFENEEGINKEVAVPVFFFSPKSTPQASLDLH